MNRSFTVRQLVRAWTLGGLCLASAAPAAAQIATSVVEQHKAALARTGT